MSYKLNKVNKGRRGALVAYCVIVSIIAVFLAYVAYTCSNEARASLYDLVIYEDGSFQLDTSTNRYVGCLNGGLCQEGEL